VNTNVKLLRKTKNNLLKTDKQSSVNIILLPTVLPRDFNREGTFLTQM